MAPHPAVLSAREISTRWQPLAAARPRVADISRGPDSNKMPSRTRRLLVAALLCTGIHDCCAAPVYLCSETCGHRDEGVCEDGGEGSKYSDCPLGTDCKDCGPRFDWGTDCFNSCSLAKDTTCDDGGAGAQWSSCSYGTDCMDCGPRLRMEPLPPPHTPYPPMPPPWPPSVPPGSLDNLTSQISPPPPPSVDAIPLWVCTGISGVLILLCWCFGGCNAGNTRADVAPEEETNAAEKTNDEGRLIAHGTDWEGRFLFYCGHAIAPASDATCGPARGPQCASCHRLQVAQAIEHDFAAHKGFVCDGSGLGPIIGMRFRLRGKDSHLCHAEFDKLTEADQLLYDAIAPPGFDAAEYALTAEEALVASRFERVEYRQTRREMWFKRLLTLVLLISFLMTLVAGITIETTPDDEQHLDGMQIGAGEPFNILGATGAMLLLFVVFASLLYPLCRILVGMCCCGCWPRYAAVSSPQPGASRNGDERCLDREASLSRKKEKRQQKIEADAERQSQARLKATKAKQDQEKRDGTCTFVLLNADYLRNMSTDKVAKLPPMQRLKQLAPEAFAPMSISQNAAFRGEYKDQICVVSHAWELPGDPDASGVKASTIRKHLLENREIEWLWLDFCCMPQNSVIGWPLPRSEEEGSAFGWQLRNANLLYLGAHVLVLLDLGYQGRFWTQFELWLSLQEGSTAGLRPVSEQSQRAHMKPIHGATDKLASSLLSLWRTKSPEDAHSVLSRADVRVTNQGDKDIHLPKILELSKLVANAFVDEKSELRSDNDLAPPVSLDGRLSA